MSRRSLAPVSYTHLDVYKRQVYTVSVREAAQISGELLRLAPALIYLPADQGAAHPEVVERCQKAGVPVAALLPRVYSDRETLALEEELAALRSMGVDQVLAGTLGAVRRAAQLGFSVRGDYGLGDVSYTHLPADQEKRTRENMERMRRMLDQMKEEG